MNVFSKKSTKTKCYFLQETDFFNVSGYLLLHSTIENNHTYNLKPVRMPQFTKCHTEITCTCKNKYPHIS